MKKILSLLLVILIIASVQLPVSAGKVNLEDCTVWQIENMFPDAFDAVKEGFENLEEDIDLTEYMLTDEQLTNIYKAVIFENPELFYVSPYVVDYTVLASNGYVFSLRPSYLFEVSEIQNKIDEFDNAVNYYLEGVKDSWPDYKKCRYIHDMLATNVEYYNGEPVSWVYTAYGALVNKQAVCQGYTLAFNYLMNKLNIKSFFIEAPDDEHSWSMVKINKNYYHIDIVWDDPSYDLLGRAMHNYCLVSDSKLKEIRPDISWKADYKASDTTYDEAWWKDVETFIYTVDGKDYYIDHTYGTARYGAFMSYNENTDKHTLLYKIKDRWYADSEKTQYWSSNFSGLVYYGKLFYFNTPTKVYSIDAVSKDRNLIFTKPDSQSRDIYGLALLRDGNLYAEYRKLPTKDGINSVVKQMKGSTLTGDANGDGILDIKDATTLQKYLVALVTMTEEQITLSDFNGDSTTDIHDVTEIQMKLANLI